MPPLRGTVEYKRPRAAVERLLVELALDGHHVPQSSAVFYANRLHGSTSTGLRSDHQGPGRYAWAADIPVSRHADGDAIASDIAWSLGLSWTGAGLFDQTIGNTRWQLIWLYPGHFDHVHIGGRRVDMVAPPVTFA